ncbi:probable LRR receptor-like serine/threonine-protein kinase RFK1 [Quercus suber]|uniref:probable LRR receptor-like serine/threonine-protein kinase RFK1 n=1 Tax=Quercus suber TaxID=58331 RepID=UPI0032DEC048
MQGRNFFFVFMIMALSCFWLKRSAEAQVPQQEVDALKEITSTMGVKDWRFDANSCQIIGVTPEPPENAESSINCDCHFENNNTVCNVVKIVLKGYSLPGMLPPQLVKLPHLREIDFAYNYLNGTIPLEWASTQLTFISVLVNRLSGEIPKELGNITTLTYLYVLNFGLTQSCISWTMDICGD